MISTALNLLSRSFNSLLGLLLRASSQLSETSMLRCSDRLRAQRKGQQSRAQQRFNQHREGTVI